MCLAVPAEVVEVEGLEALVSLEGVRKRISVALLEDVAPGDYVLVHVGHALSVISPEEARRTLELMAGLNGGEARETS